MHRSKHIRIDFALRARAHHGDGGTHDAPAVVMLDSNTAKDLIKPHMAVVCSENKPLAIVDHVEGRNSIKLTKDNTGKHHYIPLSWVAFVDDKVHIDRPGSEAKLEWSTEPK